MSTNLLPCPFCGEPARLTSRPGSEGDGVAWVAFVACYCGGYGACAHKMGRGATKESAERVAASLWNTRAVPSPAVAPDDAAMLDWLMHNVSGKALRDLGVMTSAGCDRDCIRAAMKAATP